MTTNDEFGLDPLELPKLSDNIESQSMPHRTAGAAFNLYKALMIAGFPEEQALALVGMMMRHAGAS